jgi:hypothetical protein
LTRKTQEGDSKMTKALFALGIAAAAIVSSAPADARHRAHMYACTKYRHGHCVAVHRYKVGYVFGPSYGYTAYTALPHTYVTRYRLKPDYRYVYTNGYIYVVDPATYAVVRVLNAL